MVDLGEQIRRWHELRVESQGDRGEYLRCCHPELRSLMLAFPPACLVTSSSLRPAAVPIPGRLAIITGWTFIGAAVRVQVTDLYDHLCSIRPKTEIEIELARARPPIPCLVDPSLLSVVAFSPGWTPEILRGYLH